MKRLKRIIAVSLGLLLLIPGQLTLANPTQRTDDFIFSDPVANTFTGHREGAQLVNNLRFVDLPADATAQDAIVRSSVFNFAKGGMPAAGAPAAAMFRPGAAMTRQEAIAFILRLTGHEAAALTAGAAETLPPAATAQDAIYLGFLALARNMGLITAGEFTEAFAPPIPDDLEVEELDVDLDIEIPIINFRRTDPTTREEFVHWLVQAVNARDATSFNMLGPAT